MSLFNERSLFNVPNGDSSAYVHAVRKGTEYLSRLSFEGEAHFPLKSRGCASIAAGAVGGVIEYKTPEEQAYQLKTIFNKNIEEQKEIVSNQSQEILDQATELKTELDPLNQEIETLLRSQAPPSTFWSKLTGKDKKIEYALEEWILELGEINEETEEVIKSKVDQREQDIYKILENKSAPLRKYLDKTHNGVTSTFEKVKLAISENLMMGILDLGAFLVISHVLTKRIPGPAGLVASVLLSSLISGSFETVTHSKAHRLNSTENGVQENKLLEALIRCTNQATVLGILGVLQPIAKKGLFVEFLLCGMAEFVVENINNPDMSNDDLKKLAKEYTFNDEGQLLESKNQIVLDNQELVKSNYLVYLKTLPESEQKALILEHLESVFANLENDSSIEEVKEEENTVQSVVNQVLNLIASAVIYSKFTKFWNKPPNSNPDSNEANPRKNEQVELVKEELRSQVEYQYYLDANGKINNLLKSVTFENVSPLRIQQHLKRIAQIEEEYKNKITTPANRLLLENKVKQSRGILTRLIAKIEESLAQEKWLKAMQEQEKLNRFNRSFKEDIPKVRVVTQVSEPKLLKPPRPQQMRPIRLNNGGANPSMILRKVKTRF